MKHKPQSPDTRVNLRILPDGLHLAPSADPDIWECNKSGYFPHEVFINDLPQGFLALRAPNGIAVDCGAFIGDHSSQFVGLGMRTYAIEPFLDSFVCLCYNSPHSINILGAAGDGRKVRRIYECHGENHGMRSVVEDNHGEPTIRLDDLNLPGLDLLKIDVEGCEEWVIAGAMESIMKYKPVMIVESFDEALRQRDSNNESLESRLRGLGCSLKKKLSPGVKYDWICWWES